MLLAAVARPLPVLARPTPNRAAQALADSAKHLLQRTRNALFVPDTAVPRRYARQALALARQLPPQPMGDALVFAAILHMGRVYYEQADYATAARHYHYARRLAARQGNWHRLADAYERLGNTALLTKPVAAAGLFYRQALAIHERHHNPAGVCRLIYCLGVYYDTRSDYPRAQSHFFRSLTLARELHDWNACANANDNLAALHLTRHEPALARPYLREAIAFYCRDRNPTATADCLAELGRTYLDPGTPPPPTPPPNATCWPPAASSWP